MFIDINEMFERTYGWSRAELMGRSVVEIMPPHMRDAHSVGFARYLTTEKSDLLGKPLPLSVLYKDGRVAVADHYILGDKLADGRWRFAAIIDFPANHG